MTAYVRARELCLQIGETPQLFWVLLGLSGFYHQRAELRTARELAEQCLRLAQNMRFDVAFILAHLTLGATLHSMGELSLAREQLEQGIALYDPKEHGDIRGSLQDLGVGCLSQVAQVLWLLDYPDQALKRGQEALASAQRRSHPFSIAYALSYTSRVHEMRKEQQAAQEQVEKQMVLANEQGFELFMSRGVLWRGWVLIDEEQVEEGIAQMRQGLAAFRATGAELGGPFILTWLAAAYGKAARTEEGLTVLAEAFAQVDKTGERFYEAELYRLKGELTLQQESQKAKIETDPRLLTPDPQSEAEACFLKAIEIARKQQAKSLELRSSTSLARLWQQQGKTAEAHKLLSEVYNWFTEGFDTKDLQEAKALLESLESGVWCLGSEQVKCQRAKIKR